MMPTMLPTSQILLADNDAIQAEAIADILKSEGLDVHIVLSGGEATNALRQKKQPYDIVITNLVMPNKDGLEVIKAALKYNPNCSILVLSTFSNTNEAAEAIELGAYMVVTKPLQPAHFKNVLKRLVERASLLAERNFLQGRVSELGAKIDSLETAKGRMEMLAQEISPGGDDQRARSLNELEQLANLRAKGALTEEQFRTARQFLLTRWQT
jgi:DNA-binding NtrC family response regulator